MKKYLLALPLVAALSLLSSCRARPELLAEKAKLEQAVEVLSSRLSGFSDQNAQEAAFLRQQIGAANGRLDEIRSEISSDRWVQAASTTSTIAGGLAPFVGTVFPPAVAILGALSAAAGAVATSMKKKDVV